MKNYNTEENKSQVVYDKKNIKNNDKKVLRHILKNGKEYLWQEFKRKNLVYHYILEYVCKIDETFHNAFYGKLARIKTCADTLVFVLYSDGLRGFYQAYFCKSRLCPMCNKRKSLKLSFDTQNIVETIKNSNLDLREIFVTFTVKNVKDGEELNKSLSQIHKAFHRLLDYKKIKNVILGGIRATEVTVNKKDGSYNQHIHVLMFVDKTYFSKEQNNYITQEEWSLLWKKSCKLDYIPVVHVQSVRNTLKSVLEVAKYSVKDSDYINLKIDYISRGNDRLLKKSAKIVRDLEIGLKGKRLHSYFGTCKEVANLLDIKDIEEVDLNGVMDGEKEIIAFETYRFNDTNFSYQEYNYFLQKTQGYQEFKVLEEQQREIDRLERRDKRLQRDKKQDRERNKQIKKMLRG